MDIGAVERAREQAQEYKDDKKLLQEIQELKEAVENDQLSREILLDHARQLETLLEEADKKIKTSVMAATADLDLKIADSIKAADELRERMETVDKERIEKLFTWGLREYLTFGAIAAGYMAIIMLIVFYFVIYPIQRNAEYIRFNQDYGSVYNEEEQKWQKSTNYINYTDTPQEAEQKIKNVKSILASEGRKN